MDRTTHSKTSRIVLAAVVTATTFVTFGVLGGVGFARTAVGMAQYQYGGGGGTTKVTLCHVAGPHGKRVTIRVGAPAVPAHLRHGDELGTCAEVLAEEKAAKAAKAKAQKAAKAKAAAKAAKAAKAKAAKAKAAKAKANKAPKAKGQAQKAKGKSNGKKATPAPSGSDKGKGKSDDKGNNGNGKGKGNGRP